MRALVVRLEDRNGVPDNRALFDHGGGLRTAVCDITDGRWAISYYVAADGGILLLTVFRYDRRLLGAELERARKAMHRCIEHGDDLNRI